MDDQFAKETIPVSLDGEMKKSYLDYAMSVIVGRALPDVRDGLKPVHRRVLYAMHELSNSFNRPYKKSARIVGDVIGKYHPHGDTAVYDTIVRMAQDFSLRYMLIDGQGNFGSVDGDNAAAMRYTEIRMSKISHELLSDIEKETVDFGPNYDGSEHEPLIMPTKLPNLLINGSSGIAVGMATNIPPHNLTEVIEGLQELLRKPDISIDELIEKIPAPDFPTAGIIHGISGVRDGYRTGRGRVVMRGRTHTEELDRGKREAIIVDELPYQVNKKNFIEKIAELVNGKKIDGISDLRDESDKSGMRVVIELKRGEIPDVVLNNLYKQTQLQDSFGMNMVALIDGQPKLLNLKEILVAFLRHRREVITRRTVYDLKKARDRGHVLEGLAVALENVDEMIKIIKSAETPPDAKIELMKKTWKSSVVESMLQKTSIGLSKPDGLSDHFGLKEKGYKLSDNQAQEILQLRLQRLTGLEQEKIVSEYKSILEVISDLLDILENSERVTKIIQTELDEIKAQYGDDRRSEIIEDANDLSIEDLITPQDLVVTISNTGYIKAQVLDEYRAQRRGGRGKQAMTAKEDDFIEQMFVANTHDNILCFSSRGQVYWLKVYEVPQGSRVSKGKPIVNLFPLMPGEKINATLVVKDFVDDKFIFMTTSKGTVKKTPLSDFSNPRKNGIIAIKLDNGDYLIGAEITNGENDIVLVSNGGKAVWFDENDVRSMGRNARGVRGMKIPDNNQVLSLLIASEESESVLVATENGYGKRTVLSDFRKSGRGTQGVKAIQVSDRNGIVVAARLVGDSDEIMLITTGGVLIRTRVSEIRELGRATQGVTLINLTKDEKLSGLAKIVEPEQIKMNQDELPI
ncbi:MAG: DNA gyrase subunit A [Nitrosomonadales bacterium]|jgi:DNA gyrase subunit A|nr:DNA gyrase subunit A [Nitrosomonadales bacterium]MBT4183243.1 DNA gyrase subunit A [Nitrosomonadales bacterium]MBT4759976.1 DNA gyrase subunit A [Nitrosomonadales bacterium]MBT5150455.1 DNA gyrase subunit A [Nitrosomonadales bacterium]